jgi:hypothetical protein
MMMGDVTFFVFHNNNTLKNAHNTSDYELSTLYITKALQLNGKIVIAYQLKLCDHMRESKDFLSSLELLFMSKVLLLLFISHIIKVFICSFSFGFIMDLLSRKSFLFSFEHVLNLVGSL